MRPTKIPDFNPNVPPPPHMAPAIGQTVAPQALAKRESAKDLPKATTRRGETNGDGEGNEGADMDHH